MTAWGSRTATAALLAAVFALTWTPGSTACAADVDLPIPAPPTPDEEEDLSVPAPPNLADHDPSIPAPPTLDEDETAEPVPRPHVGSADSKEEAKLLDRPDEAFPFDFAETDFANGCGGCDSSGNTCGCGSCARGQGAGYYVRAEVIEWWTNGTRLPVLLTGSEDPQGTGALDDRDTTIMWGDTRVNNRARTGFRVDVGYWFDACHHCGWEVDYFDLGLQPTRTSVESNGETVLARPFYDVLGLDQSSELIAYDGLSLGNFHARSTHYFHSVGSRFRRTLLSYTKRPSRGGCGASCATGCGDECLIEEGSTLRGQGGSAFVRRSHIPVRTGTAFRVDGVIGYRRYRMSDNLGINESIFVTGDGALAPVGTHYELNERFETSNTFHGGEVGLAARVDKGCWSIEVLAKLALGNNHQRVLIDGQTVVTMPDRNPATYSGGLLALPTNTGLYTRDQFALIPQFSFEVGYQLTDCLRVHCGYDFLYWQDIVGAGDQIDLCVNSSQQVWGQLTGEARPSFEWQESYFWAQGIRAGGELKF